MMRHLEVGQLFEPGRTRYPETVKFDFTQGGPILLLFYASPTESEIQSCRSGNLKFGFVELNGIIFILYKFDGMPWSDAPYSVHLSAPFELAEIEGGMGFGLQIYLVDADTGILKVIRYVGLGHDFSERFKEAILKQKEQPFNQADYDRTIQRVYSQYSTKDLVSFMLPTNVCAIRI